LTNVTYHLTPKPPENNEARSSEYVGIASKCGDASLGFALVDGWAREYCSEAILPKIAVGGVLVLDDAHGYLDHSTKAPASRDGKGPKNDVWTSVAEALVHWRVIWTSSGVKDTAIFIKPG